MAKPPLVFLDTNVFRDANLKRYRKKTITQKFVFGQEEHTQKFELSERYLSLEGKLEDPRQRELVHDVMSLPALYYLAKNGFFNLITSQEVQTEAMFLSYADWAGRFYDMPVEIAHYSGPSEYQRVTMGGIRKASEWTLAFLNNLNEHEYWLICIALGGAKQKNNISNLNQALDAHHIWTAKHLNCDYFLTRDGGISKKLKLVSLDLGQLKIVSARNLYFQILAKRRFLWPYYLVMSLLHIRSTIKNAVASNRGQAF
jgi:hypothetical protein